METVAPLGSIYQAGTLSGNPLAMAAGAATLRVLAEPGVYERLEALARARRGRPARGRRRGRRRRLTLNQVGPMMTLFFCEGPVRSFADGQARRHRACSPPTGGTCSSSGVYLAPSQFEAAMISLALTDDDIARAAAAAAAFFAG